MIIKLTVENFFSFAEKREISFVVDNKAPETEYYIDHPALDGRISTLNLLFGPNASGKTNLLKAIGFLCYFITDSFSFKPDEQILYEDFAFPEIKHKDHTCLSIDFAIDSVIYSYFLELTKERVYRESLSVRSFRSKRTSTTLIFNKKFDVNNKVYKLDVPNKELVVVPKQALERKNASVISLGAQFNSTLMRKIQQYWNLMRINVIFTGKSDKTLRERLDYAAKYFNSHKDILNEANSLLRTYDLGSTGMRIISSDEANKELKEQKQERYYVFGGHRTSKKKDHYLPSFLESRGTQSLFVLLRDLLPNLHGGSVIVLDDFDETLHPMMLPKIIDLFLSKEKNPHHAQLIASAHGVQVMDMLDKYQIFLTEKNEDGVSDVWRLDELKDVRSDISYVKKYLSGAFGGVPDV